MAFSLASVLDPLQPLVDALTSLPPPSRELWQSAVFYFQFFPLATLVQYMTDFFPQGKTSIDSRFNLPGRWAWFAMEIPGALAVCYCMLTVPGAVGLSARALPPGNWAMFACYLMHYAYRAVLAPLALNPSMSPIHPIVLASAASWQLANGLGIGGYVAGYGPTSALDWAGRPAACFVGLILWGWGLLGNMLHDDELREIRRQAGARAEAEAKAQSDKLGKPVAPEAVDKVYHIPQNYLFTWILFPHYLCEWIEWLGFYILAGAACVPARSFLVNEVATMLPRSLAGRRWYVRTFGAERVGDKKAVIPFLL